LGLQPKELIDCIDEAEALYLSSIVLGELFAGFGLGKHEKENRETLLRFLDLPAVEVVNIDAAIADRYGILVKILRKQGTPIPTNDIWIAAATLETGSRLVTYDAHFGCIPGLLIISP
jgi:Predicted nucleic acid-binding protein, contains PIN domain